MVVSGGDNFKPRYRDKQALMTNEQHTLLAERYPRIFAAIEAANIGIRTSLFMQITPESLGKIARAWQVGVGGYPLEMHYKHVLCFTHETVDVCLYALTPKR